MTVRYGYLGPAGTFAYAAATQLATATEGGETAEPAEHTELIGYPTVTQAVDALRADEVDGAVVPIENSVEGAVPATLDELAGNGEALIIAAEAYVQVVFDLLVRPGTTAQDIKTIATHPHAEAQTRRYVIDTFPDARVTMVGSTAGGAKSVAEGEFDAAVAAPVAGQLFGLDPLAHDIADNHGAVTRFVLLAKPLAPPKPTGNDRTTLVIYPKSDHAGGLLEILTEFSQRGVNLTRLESRPTKGRIGQYCFSIDAEGHIADARVGDAVAALHRICADVRYLGSYPRRDGAQAVVPDGRTDSAFTESTEWLNRVRQTGRG